MRNSFDNFVMVISIIFSMALLLEVLLITSFLKDPQYLKPGDEVAVLTGKTILADGKPCQQYRSGFVSPTSPEGTTTWNKPERIIYPLHRNISVILTDNTVSWVNDGLIIKQPADSKELLCAQPVSQ